MKRYGWKEIKRKNIPSKTGDRFWMISNILFIKDGDKYWQAIFLDRKSEMHATGSLIGTGEFINAGKSKQLKRDIGRVFARNGFVYTDMVVMEQLLNFR